MANKKLKSQAAMEFLMTYGWAILAAMIAIAVLAWLGIFSPGKFVSDNCLLNQPLRCDEFRASKAANTVDIVVINEVGEDIKLYSVLLSSCGNVNFAGLPGGAPTIGDGAKYQVTVPCNPATPVSGARFKSNIEVNYRKSSGGTLMLTTTGSVSTGASN